MRYLLKKATRQHTRDHNSRLVLQAIYDAEAISRAEIARLTKLTRTTVSDVVAVLLDQGLVEEVGQHSSGVGRTSTLLSITDESRQIVVVDVMARELQGAIVDMRGGVRHRAQSDLRDLESDAVLEQLFPFIDALVAAAGSRILGIGISAPGLIDTTNGIVCAAVNFGWKNVPLRDLLQTRYQLPVYLANDAQAVTLAEYMFGQGVPTSNLVALLVGQGVGAGIVLRGQLFAGDEYGAGEIGHVVVEENGLPCKCGNVGCLETVASIPSIVYRAQLLAQHDPQSLLHRYTDARGMVTFESVLLADAAGDQAVQQIVVAIGRYLGIGLAALAASLGIRRIIVTGQIVPLGERLLTSIQRELARRLLPALAREMIIDLVAQGPDTIFLGTAALVLTNELGLNRFVRRPGKAAEVAEVAA